MKYIAAFAWVSLIGFCACDDDLIVDATPKGDFEVFFEYLKKDYAYRDFHPFTMAALRQKYLPVIDSSNTAFTLASIIVSVEHDLKDPHFSLDNQIYDLARREGYRSDLEEIFPLLEPHIKILNSSPYYTYGTVISKHNIGYIHVKAFNDDIGGDNSLSIVDGVKEIDAVVHRLNSLNVTSMIVDIRSEAGGSNYVPRYIAQRFIDKTSTYMVEYYPEGSSFKKKAWVISPSGTGFRAGKIALLSNGLTGSGGEMFALAMLQRDNLIHIGSSSAGATGNVTEKDLSNGWNFTLTNSRTEFPDGKQYYQVGITPPIVIKNTEPIQKDKLIERAILELSK